MSDKITIALDAMGGDRAPHIVVKGAARVLRKFDRQNRKNIKFLLFGEQSKLEQCVKRYGDLKDYCEIIHTDDAISNDEKPSVALRNGKNSSMRLAIDAVADGRADYVVSAGNTGALMAISLFVLKRLPGIDRPAIASIFPTSKKEKNVVALDLGANLESSPTHLSQFALLGAVFARSVLGVDQPTIGLLNVGEEEGKGRESVKEAAGILREMPLPGRFEGFVEGNDIGKGTVDVVVTDGFTGNIALKTMEGTANLLYDFMKDAFFGTWLSKIVSILSYFSFKRLKKRMDPRNYNGGMMLGLNGICVKSHGGTDSKGFANAIWFGYKMASNQFNERVSTQLSKMNETNKSEEEQQQDVKSA